MSKLIRQLLREQDPRFAVALTRLEFAAGNPSIDVQLSADIMSVSRAKMLALGLDPKDTTGAELYAALRSKVIESNEYLVSYFGHPASSDQANQKIMALAKDIVGKKQVWSTKAVVLKKICKTNPPKKVMKAFHFQSIDSLVKRMDMSEVFLAARVVESKTWWDKTKKLYAGLKMSDFEQTELKIVSCDDSRWLPLIDQWGKIKGHRVLSSKETASVAFGVGTGPAAIVSALYELLRGCNEVAMYSSYLKLHYVHPSIGNVLVHAVEDGTLMSATLSGATFHWRDVHRYFGVLAEEGDVSFVHLDVHDLGWLQIETALSLQVAELAFWIGTDVVGVSYGDTRVVSMNITDIAESVDLELNHSSMITSSMERSLRSELMARYVKFPVSRALVLKQFDISGSAGEDW